MNGVRIIRSKKGGPLGAPVWDFDIDPHPDKEFMAGFSFGIVGPDSGSADLRCYLIRCIKNGKKAS